MVTTSPGVTVNKMTGKEGKLSMILLLIKYIIDAQTERPQSDRKLPTTHKIRGCHVTRP